MGKHTMRPMGPSRWAVCVALAVTCGVGVCVGFVGWRAHVFAAQDERNYRNAQELLQASQPAQALAIVRAQQAAAKVRGRSRQDWQALELAALEQMRDVSGLLWLYGSCPGLFRDHEGASLLVARGLLAVGDTKGQAALCDQWRAVATRQNAWFALDVDALLVQGLAGEAMTLLKSRSFAGKEDCGRLARLALLTAQEDLSKAWEVLDIAQANDPRNPDIRSFRAQILERVGKRDRARVEYVAAHVADPKNPFLRDQLAEFYRRSGRYSTALATWSDGLGQRSTDFIWLKALFWSRVARPIDFDYTSAKPPAGHLQPLVSYLVSLGPARFWDPGTFEGIRNGSEYLEHRQEAFWLRLLAALRSGREDEALELLRSNRFRSQSWHPELEDALQCVLNYRRLGIMNPGNMPTALAAASTEPRHQFFEQLSQWCVRTGTWLTL